MGARWWAWVSKNCYPQGDSTPHHLTWPRRDQFTLWGNKRILYVIFLPLNIVEDVLISFPDMRNVTAFGSWGALA